MTRLDRFIAAHGRLPDDMHRLIRSVCVSADIYPLDVELHMRVRHMSALESRLSGQGRPTPCYVLFATFRVLPDVLGYLSERWGDWRFWQPRGMAALFHEIWHVHQCLAGGRAAMLAAYAGGMVRSARDLKLWSHDRIPMEREAIAVQARFESAAERYRPQLAALGDRWL